MKKVAIAHLQPGMKLAQDVYYEGSRLLLLAGFILKPRYIRKLEVFNIAHVFVEEVLLVPLHEISEEKIYSEAFGTIKNVLSSVRDGNALDVPLVKETVNEIVGHIVNNESVFIQLIGIRDIDNYTFLHSIDVCIYAVICGKNLGFSNEELLELGIGSILHDIGKCKVPLDILLKPAKLTEEEFHVMKMHSLYGYEIIKSAYGLTKRIAQIARNHHERWDGSGYPLGLKEYDIDKFSRIVTIADVYDALIADRVYKAKMMPHKAAEYLLSNTNKIFDSDLVRTFISHICTYAEDTIVLLNNGHIGRVINTRSTPRLSPEVLIIASKQGPPITHPYVIDLGKNYDLYIIDILS